MTLKAAFMVAVLAAAVYATVLFVNGTERYVAKVTDGTLCLLNVTDVAKVTNNTQCRPNTTVKIPRVKYSWWFNKTHTVFGVSYPDDKCKITVGPDASKFYVQCIADANLTVVAVKDPKAKVECRARNRLLQPKNATKYVEIFETKDSAIECESIYQVAKSPSTVLVVNGTEKYVAEVKNDTLLLSDATVKIPRVRYSWEFNKTHTVFGVYYSDPSCTIGKWPNAPKFYIQCPVGVDMVVVAVKDPKAKVECRARNRPLQPKYAADFVEIFETRDLAIECESRYPAAVSTSSALIGVMAGVTVASAALLFALGLLLLRSTFLK